MRTLVAKTPIKIEQGIKHESEIEQEQEVASEGGAIRWSRLSLKRLGQ